MFHALDSPAQQFIERPRPAEIIGLELSPKGGHIDGRRDRARLNAQQCPLQFAAQPFLDAAALRRCREQGVGGGRQWIVFHVGLEPTATLSAWSRSARMSSMWSMPTLKRMPPG